MAEKTSKVTDKAEVASGESEMIAFVESWSPEAEKALVRKLDFRIFPTLIVLFILNFVDRSNFANARLKGLEKDLGLSDVQYQTCISVLLIGYVTMQVPSNMILNAVSRPSLYLCSCVAAWGVISACTGAVHNAPGAIMCRFFLGCVEAAFFPGSLYYLSRWYTRREMQMRVTVLNAGNLAAQAFGGLIAAGILGNMEGDRGLRAWRWLFIIEGSITVVLAGVATLLLPNFPISTKWLTPEERRIAITRLAIDGGATRMDGEDDLTSFQGLKLAAKDPKVWLLGFTCLITIMGLSFSFFFPTITQALGYGPIQTLLLTAPPWIFTCVVSLVNAWHGDRTGDCFFHYLWTAVACIVGYIISVATRTTAPRYIAMFLMTLGYAAYFVNLAWISHTFHQPAAKKAAAIGIINAMGNVGSIPGSYIWPAAYGPYYVKSFAAEIAILGFACILAFVFRCVLVAENKKLDAAEAARIAEVNEGTKSSSDPANAVPVKGFRYLY